MNDLSFPLFAVMWNQLQRQATPVLHIRLARWLEQGGALPLRLLMAFRGAGKSTLVGLYCAWLLYRNPNARILVLAAEDQLAGKMVRQVKRILERHPATKHLRPRFADQWASDRFTVKRSMELRDPSMLAKGVGGNVTGCRAEIVICDDVEVPNTCDSADKRADLRARLAELSYILTPGGQILYVGTPHHSESLYNEDGFLSGAERLVIPVVDEQGLSAWPERFTSYEIERIKRQAGPLRFAAQMMLQPVAQQDLRLDPDHLLLSDEPPFHEITQKVAAWDPAYGAKGGDGSVLAVACSLRGGRFHVSELVWLRSHEDCETDAATQQCRAVILLLQRHGITRLMLETNGIGKFLPALLRKELKLARHSCAVIETVSRKSKAERILSVFDPLLAARALTASHAIAQTGLFEEMRNFSASSKHGKDDGLDAAAQALLSLSVFINSRKDES